MPPNRSASSNQAPSFVERYRPAIERELRALVPVRTGPPYDLMRYHLGWEDERGRPIAPTGQRGKLLRPSLCLLACDAVGGGWRAALPAAAALELLHNFTLIHDDVEDASRRRHGRPTLWSLRGEALAINAGDGMFALAELALLRLHEHDVPARRVLRGAVLLNETTLRLCEGQHLDLTNAARRTVSPESYLATIEGKSAALLATSAGLGALLGGASERSIAALTEFGRRLGLAFQIRDDVLGIWGDVAETGKHASDDLREGKRSYPVVAALASSRREERAALLRALDRGHVRSARALLDRLGAREESEREAREHAQAAIASLEGVRLRPARHRELALLAHFAAERRS